MKLTELLTLSDIAGLGSGFSAVEQAIEEQRRQREHLIGLHSKPYIDEIIGELSSLSRMGTLVEADRRIDSYLDLVGPSRHPNLVVQEAMGSLQSVVESARLAGSLELPDLLEEFRIPDISFAARLVDAHRMPWWNDLHLEALNVHSALSEMLEQCDGLDLDTWSVVGSAVSDQLVGINSVRQAREFLNLSGLLRLPRFRCLTIQEKRRRITRLKRENSVPKPVRKAQSLVYQNERLLRAFIAQGMEDAYGENWAQERLPKCDCQRLLKKSPEVDETYLDHADYKHYENIMCHEEHFEAVFATGYADIDELRATIARLGTLRARSHHARRFTAEDLKELTILWRAVEAGFEAFVDDVVLDEGFDV